MTSIIVTNNTLTIKRMSVIAHRAGSELMAGAKAIEIGTANFLNPAIAGEMAEGINRWLDKHGCKSVDEIIGVAQ